jgi:hypothetical protein
MATEFLNRATAIQIDSTSFSLIAKAGTRATIGKYRNYQRKEAGRIISSLIIVSAILK